MRPSVDVSTSDEKPSLTLPSAPSVRRRSCRPATRTPAVRTSASSRARWSASCRACSGVRPVPATDADTSTTRVSARAESAARPSDSRSALPLIAGLFALPFLVSLHLAIELLERLRGLEPRAQTLLRPDLLEGRGVGLAGRHLHLHVGEVRASVGIQRLFAEGPAAEWV